MSKWKTVRLGDVLTPAQVQDVANILNSDATPYDRLRTLKAYLGQHRSLLAQHELDPDFLAYSLLWQCDLL